MWAKLREDLVVQAQAKVLKTDEVIKFGEPPHRPGTQVRARVHVTEESQRGMYQTVMRRIVRIEVPETPGTKYQVVKYQKGGQEGTEETRIGEVRETFVVPGYIAERAVGADGQQLPVGMSGEYMVEFSEDRRGRSWGVKVVREAVALSEPMVDLEVYMGQSTRDASQVWVVAADGSLFAQKSGSGTFKTQVPVSALVLRHQSSNYGYCNTENWEVHMRPQTLTPEQLVAAEHLATELSHVYFHGEGTGWDFGRVGVVRYATPYFKAFRDADEAALRAMQAQYPVDVTGYEQQPVRPQPNLRQENVLRWIEVGPHAPQETSLGAAFKRAR